MKYKAVIDVKLQRFVIEDETGLVIAQRLMPTTISLFINPTPSQEYLMAKPDNAAAWEKVCKLVEAANRISNG